MLLECVLQMGAFCLRGTRVAVPHKGVFRLLCVGDSHTYGIGAEKGMSYPEQLQKILDEKTGKHQVQVINAGRPGFSTAMLAERFNAMLDCFSPDAVMVMTGANDYWNFEDLFLRHNSLKEKIDDALNNLRSYRLLKIIAMNLNNQFGRKILYDDFNFERLERDKAKKNIGKDLFKPIAEYTLGLKEARHYKLQGDYRKALIVLFHVRCFEFLPNIVYQEMDDVFIAWGDFDEAISFYHALKEVFPKDSAVDLRLGRMYKAVQDYRQSKEYFSAVLIAQPDCREAQAGALNAEKFLVLGMACDYTVRTDQYKEIIAKEFFDAADSGVRLTDEDYPVMADFLRAYRQGVGSMNMEEQEALLCALYREKLKYMCMLARKKNVRLFFLSYPTFVRDYMLKTIEEERVDFIDLRTTFEKMLTKENVTTYFIPDGHCTAAGYRIVAEAVCRKVIVYLNPMDAAN